ncbi:hypothetical protein SODALDRAFT_348568 [Sodiomyces alkalinus F11]|uniref:Uncharacterized protein n=1 Tax=Sodiomyces alkalinus (strain CBS 110278 / VKM F-3762 / F11) TaxID=1314773 RepID=A0A3N2Q0L9_SODAK|nr:hypothetical protein SODALDRAFT_348568 [Sodiomyces alkalinus F11]ROT40292.1 hypothetical protein SODALDRAFT_348568 [Sodiomyces alkalinus F11]
MLGILPDLTPRDSHSVWYTSSRNPSHSPFIDSGPESHPRHQQYDHGDGDNGGSNVRRQGQAVLERSLLVRLRADEQYMERRRINIQNFGAAWLKPPGVPKTLHQMREERREAEEHAEAMRREQMQQDLAEAEAAGLEMEDAGESGDPDDMGDGARDLDEEIPDASAMDMGMSAIDEDTTVSSVSSASITRDDDDDDNDSDDEAAARSAEARQEQRRNELIQARMRMADDAFRQALARGDPDAGDIYDVEEELEAEGQGEILFEEVFRNARLVGEHHFQDGEPEEDLNMDANLDDSIPEGGELSGVYEHTDSEAGLSSSSSSSISSSSSEANRDVDMDFAPRSSLVGATALRPPDSPTLQARGDPARGHRMRRSMDLSSLLSAGDSSVLGSSPQRGPSRR